MHRFTFILAVGMLTVPAMPLVAAPTYSTFLTIDGPSTGGTTINGISNSGALVGFTANADNTQLTNFVRNPNGTLTTFTNFTDPMTMANGLNTMGVLVGTTGGNAFSQSNGVTTPLPPVLPGNTASQVAFGINDNKTIVGQFVENSTDTTPGFVYQNGKYTVLNPTAGAVVTNAQGVNNQNLVTGFYSLDGAHQHGFFYNINSGSFTLIADPVQPNLFLTQFLGINDNGLAVGYWQDVVGSQHGFLYDIATKTYSFMDEPNAGINDGVEITQITGINDANQIAGFYIDGNGAQHGFLANPVPEPAAMLLFGLGLISVAVSKRTSFWK